MLVDCSDQELDVAVVDLNGVSSFFESEELGLESLSRLSDINSGEHFESVFASSSPTITKSKVLGVPHIYQGQRPFCWAAAAAQAGQYLTGKNIGSIYSLVQSIKGSVSGGTMADAATALGRFYYDSSTSVNATEYAYDMSDAETQRWIDNGVPFLMWTVGTDNSWHAVTADGYRLYSNGEMTIRLMNPGPKEDGAVYAFRSGGRYGYYYDTAGSGIYAWWQTLVCDGWQKPFGGSRWSWVNFNGTLEKGWMQKYGNWYWFDSNGYLIESQWRKIDGSWYYFNPGGSMKTGWYYDGAYWFYLGSDGAARIGWHSIDGYWYSFDNDGGMRRGWYYDGSTWYYLRTASNVPSGGPAGSMLCSGSWTIDGKTYRFDSSGACLNP